MATSSTVTAARARIVSLLTANGALSGVQISHGYPGEGLIKRKSIYVDRVTGRHTIANIKSGRKQRDEEYTVTVGIAVIRDKGTIAAAESEAFDMLEEVEDMVADDPSLGDLDGIVHATAGEFRVFSELTSGGPACVIEFDIDVRARLI